MCGCACEYAWLGVGNSKQKEETEQRQRSIRDQEGFKEREEPNLAKAKRVTEEKAGKEECEPMAKIPE